VTLIDVHFQSMSDAAAQIKASVGALTGHVDEMNQLLNGLRDTWQGVAGLNWQDVQGKWNNNAGDVHQILADLHSATVVSLDNYATTHHGLVKFWSGV
jgi:WXG100 family type VII secretion target